MRLRTTPKCALRGLTEAAGWLFRLAASPGRTLPPFLRWLQRCPEHPTAFARLAQVDAVLDKVPARVWAALQSEVDSARERGYAGRGRHRVQWLSFAAIGMATVACLMTLPAMQQYLITHPPAQRYATQIGESQQVDLKDGSIILLNTNSRIQVRVAPQHVRVTLLQGEALFTIAHNPSRLFEVTSSGTTITDRGTTFSVRMRANSVTTVLVARGRVEITRGAARQTVSADEVATIRDELIRTHRTSVSQVQDRLEWASGWLVFSGDSLQDAVDEINRYNRRRLVIEDPDVATIRIAGSFRTTDLDSFVAALSALHVVGQRADAGTIRLVRRSSP